MLRSYVKDLDIAGIQHDLTAPLRARLKTRKGPCGPYFWHATRAPSNGRCFYSSCRDALVMDRAGSTLDLRLSWANPYLTGQRVARITGYFCDMDGDGDTLRPIVATLPRSRGYLAGWTMGAGMLGNLDAKIYDTTEDAALAAHDMAERDAERNREHCEERRP